jgi:hypothetical protein
MEKVAAFDVFTDQKQDGSWTDTAQQAAKRMSDDMEMVWSTVRRCYCLLLLLSLSLC